MTFSRISSKIFRRTLPHGVLRFENWIRENRHALDDLILVVFMVAVIIPLIYMTDASETLYLYSRAHESWWLNDIVLSLAVASFLLAIFATRRWIEAVGFLQRSNTDSLTGLYNRRKGWEVLEREMQRAKRYQRPLSLIMFDIDHYKEINDFHGHPAGDRVLKKVSRTVQAELRVTDTLVRWGGDEFMIISVETDLPTAHQLAERLRASIESNPAQDVGKATASFGVAQFDHQDDFNSLTRRADDRLYAAKTQGRNRVA